MPLDWDGHENWYRPDELRKQLDNLLELAMDQLVEAEGELRVEFRLDYKLVHQDVDQWMIGADVLSRPLGAEYVVVVRPRRIKPSEKHSWSMRWRALQSASGPAGELCVWVKDENAYSDKALWGLLRANLAKVLVVPLGPCEKTEDRLYRLLQLGLQVGVPIALCVRRRPADAVQILSKLEGELAEKPLADLPDQVRRWREEAFLADPSDPDHVGHHLTLLWDDYDRRLDDQLGLTVVRGPN